MPGIQKTEKMSSILPRFCSCCSKHAGFSFLSCTSPQCPWRWIEQQMSPEVCLLPLEATDISRFSPQKMTITIDIDYIAWWAFFHVFRCKFGHIWAYPTRPGCSRKLKVSWNTKVGPAVHIPSVPKSAHVHGPKANQRGSPRTCCTSASMA